MLASKTFAGYRLACLPGLGEVRLPLLEKSILWVQWAQRPIFHPSLISRSRDKVRCSKEIKVHGTGGKSVVVERLVAHQHIKHKLYQLT